MLWKQKYLIHLYLCRRIEEKYCVICVVVIFVCKVCTIFILSGNLSKTTYSEFDDHGVDDAPDHGDEIEGVPRVLEEVLSEQNFIRK